MCCVSYISCVESFDCCCSDPTFSGGGTIYSSGFFLLSQLWPIDIFIVESCEWYH